MSNVCVVVLFVMLQRWSKLVKVVLSACLVA